jgi:hypothetical protein
MKVAEQSAVNDNAASRKARIVIDQNQNHSTVENGTMEHTCESRCDCAALYPKHWGPALAVRAGLG